MIALLTLLLLVVVASSSPLTTTTAEDLFEAFRRDFRKDYADEAELAARFDTFQSNLARIVAHNRDYELGRRSFYLGVNEFADFTEDEFRGLKGYRHGGATPADFTHVHDPRDSLPDSVDWRDRGVVTRVKNQAQCGSCWSFSATGAMEGAHARATGALLELSEQQLVDCVDGGADDCATGGEMARAFRYAMRVGAEAEAAYPYRATSGHRCRDTDFRPVARFAAFVNVTAGDEMALQHALARHPTVSVAIDASSFEFQLYAGGVYDNPECGNQPEQLDHGVLAVGYGTGPDGDFWIVKNSWGPSWGDRGYIRMARNRSNQCGIATDASYILVGHELLREDARVAVR